MYWATDWLVCIIILLFSFFSYLHILHINLLSEVWLGEVPWIVFSLCLLCWTAQGHFNVTRSQFLAVGIGDWNHESRYEITFRTNRRMEELIKERI